MSLPIAVLCGGLATRLGEVTRTTPKAMLEIAGEPFIAHQLRLFKKNNIQQVVLCCGHLAEAIEDFVGGGERFGLDVQYSYDGETLKGTGGAIRKALPLLGERFMVVYGDSYLDTDYGAAAAHFIASGKPAMMCVFKNTGQWDISNVVFEGGQIKRYDKRVTDRNSVLNYDYIDYGMGCFKAELFASWPQDSFDLAELYRKQVESGDISGYEVFTRFYEIGSNVGIEETSNFLKAGNHG